MISAEWAESPSHPELLDWLAVWFRDEAKGSIKALHRLIVTSDTWKQTTLADQGAAVDGDNRLLWRQNRPRLTGEEVRDTLLALSGQLDLTMGGPPAVQFIDHGDATFNSGGNPAFLDYEHFDPDSPAARRRAIYRFLFRTVPDPFMDALDCPGRRRVYAGSRRLDHAGAGLAMLNNAFLIRQCEHIAARLGASGGGAGGPGRGGVSLHSLCAERERTNGHRFAAIHSSVTVWPMPCQLLLNSNEFLYLD